MPISIEELDSSTREENITLIVGKNILLKIIEDLERKALLKNKVIKDFIATRDLCHDDIRLRIEGLFAEEALMGAPGFVRSLFDLAHSPGFEVFLSKLSKFDGYIRELTDSKFQKTIWTEFEKFIQQKFEKMTKEEKESFQADILRRTLGKVGTKAVHSGNRKLISISKKLKEKIKIDVLVPTCLLLCPKCGVVLSVGEFRGSKKCYICSKSVNREKAGRIHIYKVHDEIREIWRKNLWFEGYMARLLRGLGFKTWTSVHVMGASGILHEIDVLAIRKGIVLVSECKTGKVSRNDVFNFCTKVSDLKAHVSILALIGELPETETREFVKKNPAIIRLEKMGSLREVDILTELEQRLIKIS